MQLFIRMRLLVLAALISLIAACTDTYVDERLRYVSTGMSGAQVTRLLGSPTSTYLKFETGTSKYRLTFDGGQLNVIDYESDRPKYYVFLREERVVYAYGYGEPPPHLAAPVRLGMSRSEVEAALGSPNEDCRHYFGDAAATMRVCFKSDRVISKEARSLPIT